MYKVVKSEKTHIGRFNVVLDSVEKEGEIHPYSYIEFTDAVCVIPFVDENHVVLLKEYRHAIRQWVYSFPGGMIEEGELQETTVQRELLEETGYEAEELIDLGYVYPSYGSTTEKIYLYAAKVKKTTETDMDALELVELEVVSVMKLEKMIEQGIFVQGAGMAAWLKWKMRR